MNELERFASLCRDSLEDEDPWLLDFGVNWVDSEGHAEFTLKGSRSTATVEWTKATFRIVVIGPDIVYHESSRSVDTAEKAIGRLSSLLCK